MYQALQVLNSGGLLWLFSCILIVFFPQRQKRCGGAMIYRLFAILCTPDFSKTTLKLISKPNLHCVSFR